MSRDLACSLGCFVCGNKGDGPASLFWPSSRTLVSLTFMASPVGPPAALFHLLCPNRHVALIKSPVVRVQFEKSPGVGGSK